MEVPPEATEELIQWLRKSKDNQSNISKYRFISKTADLHHPGRDAIAVTTSKRVMKLIEKLGNEYRFSSAVFYLGDW
jgi:hypothetical protein